jgi:hypothetical protein
MFFMGLKIGFDETDFYAGYEDFRTSLHPAILYNLPMPTGMTTSYRTGDAANIETIQLLHFRAAMSKWNGNSPKLANFTTLKQNNAFGNTKRFTDDAGGTAYSNAYLIDHYTGLGWSTTLQGTRIWNAAIDESLSSSYAGFTDWFLPNHLQLLSIHKTATPESGFGYTPFNFGISNQLISSTTDPNPTTKNLLLRGSMNNIVLGNKTDSQYVIFCRKHF